MVTARGDPRLPTSWGWAAPPMAKAEAARNVHATITRALVFLTVAPTAPLLRAFVKRSERARILAMPCRTAYIVVVFASAIGCSSAGSDDLDAGGATTVAE